MHRRHRQWHENELTGLIPPSGRVTRKFDFRLRFFMLMHQQARPRCRFALAHARTANARAAAIDANRERPA
jgi:hypothetical protein